MKINGFFYPDEFDLSHTELSALGLHSSSEIGNYLRKKKSIFEYSPSLKLSRILNKKANELEIIEDRIKLSCEHKNMEAIALTLYNHEDNQIKNNKITPYTIDRKFEDVVKRRPPKKNQELLTYSMFRDELVPVIYHLSESLKSFKKLPKEKQEILRKFGLDFCETISPYAYNRLFRSYLVA